MKKTYKIRKLAITLSIAALLMVGSFTALAAGPTETWSASLRSFRNGSDLISGKTYSTITSGKSAASVYLDGMGGEYETMWLLLRAKNDDGNWNDVSNSPKVSKGGNAKVIANCTLNKGKTLMLVGGNDAVTYVSVSANGRVQFQ